MEKDEEFSDNTPTEGMPDGFRGMSSSFGANSPSPSRWSLEGSTVGNYKFLERLGEGGMGHVYVAERRKPIRQKVAIKVIKPGMDSREILARFDAERQALAIMDHPNVARILDAGSLENGLPYFVMDLVKGQPINAYCDSHKLGIEERLSLFHQVCLGVSHAHQKGIIHRDLKPSNVIVTVNNGQLIPKVIDFGIAKATGFELTEKTFHTLKGQVIGTPQYMSPEQAELNHRDSDTRTDIYSLGAMLYELLTGHHAVPIPGFEEAGLDTIFSLIREKEPIRPSILVGGLEAAKLRDVAASRNTDPGKLRGELKGDLDWIAMKALEKEPYRRYETANAFALDIECFLRKDEVSATPPTIGYRLSKTLRRHRGPIITFTALFLSLVVGLVVSIWQGYRAYQEATRAKEAETMALINLGKANEQRLIAEDQTRKAKEAENRAADALKAAADSNAELNRTNQNLKEEKQKALQAKLAAEKSRREAEQALDELARGRIAIAELEGRISNLLAFLRNEDIRGQMQKKNANGIEIIQSIDDKLASLFPEAGKNHDFLNLDYQLALKLGTEAILSFETSLTTAHKNLSSALNMRARINQADSAGPERDLLDNCICFVGLAQIERHRGNFGEAEGWLDRAAKFLLQLDDASLKGAELRTAIQLEFSRIRNSLKDTTAEREAALKAFSLSTGTAEWKGRPLKALESAVAVLLSSAPFGREMIAQVDLLRHRADTLDDSSRQLLALVDVLLLMRDVEKQNATPDPGLSEKENELERAKSAQSLFDAFSEYRRRTKTENRITSLLNLRGTLEVARILASLGKGYESIQTYDLALKHSSRLARLDNEMIAPFQAQFEACNDMASIYYREKEYAKQLSVLEMANSALGELKRMQFFLEQNEIADFHERLVKATIFQFYVSSSSDSVFDENAFMASTVDYFGKDGYTREEIYEGQKEFREKYPHRYFQVKSIRDPITIIENDVFETRVEVEHWLSNPLKANTINFNKPEGTMTMDLRFAFDADGKLKISKVERIN